MKKCDDLKCKYNAQANIRMKRYGHVCLRTGSCTSSHVLYAEPEISANVRYILKNSVSDCNFNTARLTDRELDYCLLHEKRKTGQRKLRAEQKRRAKIENI